MGRLFVRKKVGKTEKKNRWCFRLFPNFLVPRYQNGSKPVRNHSYENEFRLQTIKRFRLIFTGAETEN